MIKRIAMACLLLLGVVSFNACLFEADTYHHHDHDDHGHDIDHDHHDDHVVEHDKVIIGN